MQQNQPFYCHPNLPGTLSVLDKCSYIQLRTDAFYKLLVTKCFVKSLKTEAHF